MPYSKDFMDATLQKKIGAVFVILLLVVGAWQWGVYSERNSAVTHHQFTECHRTYNLLDKTLDCERVDDAVTRISGLEQDVGDIIDKKVQEKIVSRVGVFYRDLTTRRWFGINADAEFYPASLAKLPLGITYFKVADLEPQVLDQVLPLTVQKEYTNEGQKVSVDSPMVPGQSYSVRRMIEDLLEYSDNRPIAPLLNFMRQDVWKKVYADFGIRKQKDDGTEEWSVTPRVISNVLRSLYNGSYLDLGSSQELLEIMTRARYTRGIVAGVDHDVLVAHKFGEATMVEADGSYTPTLHDCGIVYKPDAPYILCVMTEGKDFTQLEFAIAEISKVVFDAQ